MAQPQHGLEEKATRMDKTEAQKSLAEVRSKIAQRADEEKHLRKRLADLAAEVTELCAVARYLSRVAGETNPQPVVRRNITQMTIADAAAELVSVGEQVTTAEVAERLLRARYPYNGGQGRLVGTLGTVLARNPGFERLRPGMWGRVKEKELFDQPIGPPV
jgi:hypothetical protein